MFYSTARAKTCRRGPLLCAYARRVRDRTEDGAARKAAYEGAVAACIQAGADPGLPTVLPEASGTLTASPRILAAVAATAPVRNRLPATGADAWDAWRSTAYVVQLRGGRPRLLGRLDLADRPGRGAGSPAAGAATAPAASTWPADPRSVESSGSQIGRCLSSLAAAPGASLAAGSSGGSRWPHRPAASAPAPPTGPHSGMDVAGPSRGRLAAQTPRGAAAHTPRGAAADTLTGEGTSADAACMLTAASYDSLDAMLLEGWGLGPGDMLVDERPVGHAHGQGGGPAGQPFRCIDFSASDGSSHLACATGEWSTQPASVSTLGRHGSFTCPPSTTGSAAACHCHTGPAAALGPVGGLPEWPVRHRRLLPPAGHLSDCRSCGALTAHAHDTLAERWAQVRDAPASGGKPGIGCRTEGGPPRPGTRSPARGVAQSAGPYLIEAVATDAAVTMGLCGEDMAAFMGGWDA